MAKRMTANRRAAILAVARESTRFYNIELDLDASGKIEHGHLQHMDDDIPPTPGYWIPAWVFVAEDSVDL